MLEKRSSGGGIVTGVGGSGRRGVSGGWKVAQTFFDVGLDKSADGFQGSGCGIDAKVVGFGFAPVAIGEETIIGLSVFFDSFDFPAGVLGGKVFALHDALDAGLHGSVEEDAEDVWAAGCSREVIERGADMLGWELDTLIDRTLQAMRVSAAVD